MLQNIETYLVEEEVRMIAQDKKWKEYQIKENLKEMGDVSSGMASTVIQIYLSSVLDSFIHPSVQVRTRVLNFLWFSLTDFPPGEARGIEGDPVDPGPGSRPPGTDRPLPHLYVH